MARHATVDAAAHGIWQRCVGVMHVDELSVSTGCGKLDRMKRGSFRRDGVVGVIGVIAFSRNIDAPVL
jgi:hypothetical protein